MNSILIIIFLLMVMGSYQDFKTRTVSNKLTGSIAVLSLIYFLTIPFHYLQGFFYFFWLHFLILAGILISYKLKGIGGADLKVMVPLIFTFSTIPLFFFTIISTTIQGMIYFLYDKRTPYFISLTTAFILVVFISK